MANNDGVWSDSAAAWDFSVRPMFYETLWFRAAGVLTLGLVAAAAWRFRVHKERERFSLVLAERTRVAREIHDTLLQSLVGITIHLDAVTGELDGSHGRARTEFERFRKQLELVIREARQSIRDLRSPYLRTHNLQTALRERDNGRGFDTTVPVFNSDDHWGLASMQERAELIGAQFRLASEPGLGTVVEIVVPSGSEPPYSAGLR